MPLLKTDLSRFSTVLILWIFLCLESLSVYGQAPCKEDSAKWSYDFGKSLSLDGLPIEKTDRILYREEDIDFFESGGSIEVIIRRHEVKRLGSANPYSRIVNIPFYAQDSVEQIVDLRGFSHTMDGRKIPLDTSQTRIIELNNRYLSLEFVMPEADSGSVIEYAYSLRRKFIEELPDFYIQESVPVEKAVLRIHYPDYIRYAAQSLNAYGLDVCRQIIEKDTSSIPPVFVYRRPPPLTTEIWKAQNIPAIPEEQLAGNVDDLKAKLVFKMSEFGRPRQPLEISWEVVLAQYRKEQKLFGTIDLWKNTLSDSLKNAWLQKSEEDRLLAIFRHLNDPIKLDLSFSVVPKTPEEIADKAFDQWTQADVNAQLIAYLIECGLDAKPVLAPIESVGRIRSGYPSRFKLNTLLAYVEIGNKPIWLDASVPASTPNLLRAENLGREALVLEKRSHRWIRTTASESLYGVQAKVDAKLAITNALDGQLKAELRGYPAQMILQKMRRGEQPLNLVRSLFFDAYNLVELDSVEISSEENLNRSVNVSAQFRIPEYGISFQDAIDFRPLVVGYRFDNPIAADRRSLPIRLDAPEYIKLDFEIELDKDSMKHELEDFRQSLTLPSGYLSETFNFSKSRLNYHFETILSSREYDAQLFERVNAIYERWIELSQTRWPIKRVID